VFHGAAMQRSTILIVEDDPFLRADTVMILEDAGLTVIEKADADEALGFLLEHATEVAAVFTDINMPGHSDGLHLAEMVSRHWPQIGVVVTSGFERPWRVLPARVHFIPKPWRVEQIVAAMQDLVEAA
jgi:DNA-binding NtrC family response regulator